MLPPRPLVVARSSAGVFALVAGLSLINGTTEWTAAFRGLAAATAAVVIAPYFYDWLERAWTAAPQAKTEAAQTPNSNINNPGAAAQSKAPRNP